MIADEVCIIGKPWSLTAHYACLMASVTHHESSSLQRGDPNLTVPSARTSAAAPSSVSGLPLTRSDIGGGGENRLNTDRTGPAMPPPGQEHHVCPLPPSARNVPPPFRF